MCIGNENKKNKVAVPEGIGERHRENRDFKATIYRSAPVGLGRFETK